LFNSLKPASEAIKFLKAGQEALPGSVNMYGGDNFILIRFRTPRIFDIVEDNGDDNKYTEVDTFSGVYKVISVKSRFEMGKFVQDLDCILDPVINLKDISALIEFDAANPDTPTTVESFIPFKKYNGSNAPDQSPSENARIDAGIITQSEAETARLKRSGYTTQSEAETARLKRILG
jgi:hypothetical protein